MSDERAGQAHVRTNRRVRRASDVKILDIFAGCWSLRLTHIVTARFEAAGQAVR
jgi:hypothetical protein